MNIIFQPRAGWRICTAGSQQILHDDRLRTLTPGTLIVMSPVIPIRTVSQTDDFCAVEIFMPFSAVFPLLKGIVGTVVNLGVFDDPILPLTPLQMDFFVRRAAELDALTDRLEAATDDAQRHLCQTSLTLLLQHTFFEVIHDFFLLRGGQGETTQTQRRAIVPQFILSLNMNFRRERSVQFYASEAHMTSAYFSRLIREYTGHTPSQFIATVTCNAAKSMLRHTPMTVKEIAADLGFPEQFTFRKYFKTHVGLSPTDYRAKHAEET